MMRWLRWAVLALLPFVASAQPPGGGSLVNPNLTFIVASPTNGQVLTYVSAAGAWENGTGGGGSSAFSALTSGTNTTAAMGVGSGASLDISGTGVLQLNGFSTSSLPTCNSSNKGQVVYTTDGTAAETFCNGSTWVNSGGTTFTYAPTGCTPSAATGTATSGSITLASGPCTSIVITFNGAIGMTAADGWTCSVGDRTAQNAGTWIQKWGESASNTTTATIPIPGAAGATDVITFACTEY